MFFTVVSVIALGWLLLIGGAIEAVQAIRHRHQDHLLLYLLEALVAVVAGLLLLRSPGIGAAVLTLLLASYFIVVGGFRIVTALSFRLPNWGWMLANGVISVLLGIFVWAGWPLTAMWVLGLFVGIHLIVAGWARVMLALAVHEADRDHFHPVPA